MAQLPASLDLPAVTVRIGRTWRMRRAPDLLLCMLLCLILLSCWQALVQFGLISRFVLPLPTSIVPALFGLLAGGEVWPHVAATLGEAASGLAIALAVGLSLGALIAEFRVVERVLYPYLVALQTVPKIALAPLLLVWFGFGAGSKIAVAAVISLFPVLVNTIAGLQGGDAGRLDVLRALGATRWDCFRLVKLPDALPYIFSGLGTAVMFALTGALVGEFVGSSHGLGYLIIQANSRMDIAQAFAIVTILAAIGLAAFGIVQVLRRKLLYWAPKDEAWHP